MKMALKGNTLILVEVDNVQFSFIKGCTPTPNCRTS